MRRFGCGIAAAAAVLAGVGCRPAGGAPGSDPALAPVAAPAAAPREATVAESVEIRRVAKGPLEANLAASGTIRARRVTAIGSEVPGRLEEVFVDVGDAVAAEAPLFRVDPTPFELGLAEAEAALALARAESENAAQEAERVRQLLAQRAASKRHHDQLRTAAAVARARVAQMEARVARARRDLQCAGVRAPYAGTVVERLAHEGAMVGSEPVLVLQETGALEAVLAIPEAWPAPVRIGDRVQLRAPGLARPLATHVTRVNERIDPSTRTYEVRAPVPPDASGLKAGSYVESQIGLRTGGAVPVVDRSALVRRDGHTYAFRVETGRARRVEVRLGLEADGHVEVRAGLDPGDEVVVGEVISRLEDGLPVAPAAPVSAAAEETP